MMDIILLYQDFGIDFITEGHKHCTEGWVNTHCPFCAGSRNYHLGYDIENGFFTCWRCGWHPPTETIAKLIGVSVGEAKSIIRQYAGAGRIRQATKEPVIKVRAKGFKMPSGTGPLQEQHKRYLRDRKFIPEKLEQEWGLLGTGPVAKLDDINYCHRVIIPIIWEGKIVSFQGRDITGRAERKYMACPQDRELIEHKTILYGQSSVFESYNHCICVEGVVDAWRVGSLGVATFGIKYTEEQIRLLSKFRRVIVWFDEEPQAQEQAKKLCSELRFRGVSTAQIIQPGDPGGTDQNEVDLILGRVL